MLLAILTIVLKINIYPGQWKQQQETSVKYKRNVEYVETKIIEINVRKEKTKKNKYIYTYMLS